MSWKFISESSGHYLFSDRVYLMKNIILHNSQIHTHTHTCTSILAENHFGKESMSLFYVWVAAAKLLQSCPTLHDPIDGSPPGSPVPGILQARTLEWVAISFSSACKWKVKVKLLSRVWFLATHGLQPTRLLHPWDFPGKSTGVGCHCLLHLSRLLE